MLLQPERSKSNEHLDARREKETMLEFAVVQDLQLVVADITVSMRPREATRRVRDTVDQAYPGVMQSCECLAHP